MSRERRRLAAMVSVRFTPEEVDRVRATAARLGMSLSAFVRDAALSKRRRVPLPRNITVTCFGPAVFWAEVEEGN